MVRLIGVDSTDPDAGYFCNQIANPDCVASATGAACEPAADADSKPIPVFKTDCEFGFSSFVIGLYMIGFGSILLFYELNIPKITEKLRLYFGFIFFYNKRVKYLIFIGFLAFGVMEDWDKKWFVGPLTGFIAVLDGLFHKYAAKIHPDIDNAAKANAESIAGTGGGGVGAAPQFERTAQERQREAPTGPPATEDPFRQSSNSSGFTGSSAPAEQQSYNAPAPQQSYNQQQPPQQQQQQQQQGYAAEAMPGVDDYSLGDDDFYDGTTQGGDNGQWNGGNSTAI